MPPRENRQLVLQWVTWLNRVHPPGPWMPILGFTSTMTTVPQANNGATFSLTNGYVMKSFINSSTGEIKSFDARRFYV